MKANEPGNEGRKDMSSRVNLALSAWPFRKGDRANGVFFLVGAAVKLPSLFRRIWHTCSGLLKISPFCKHLKHVAF